MPLLEVPQTFSLSAPSQEATLTISLPLCISKCVGLGWEMMQFKGPTVSLEKGWPTVS